MLAGLGVARPVHAIFRLLIVAFAQVSAVTRTL